MGGLGPGIGGFEYLIIAIVALVVVGPERLPLMLRKLGQWVAKARRMADEFRSSFDEMARQSELDELRKEVEALRRGQSNMLPLGPEAEATFREIRDDLNRPVDAPPTPAPALETPDEWPDSAPVMAPLEPTGEPTAPATPRKRKSAAVATADAKPRAPTRKAGSAAATAAKPKASKPKAARPKKVDL